MFSFLNNTKRNQLALRVSKDLQSAVRIFCSLAINNTVSLQYFDNPLSNFVKYYLLFTFVNTETFSFQLNRRAFMNIVQK